VSLGLPTHRVEEGAEFVSAEAISSIARAAEDAGFESVYVTDHPFPGDAWLAHGGHHTLDPFVALAIAAGATTRLRLLTNLLIVAYRNPFVTAKAVASLDVASAGRVTVGIGAGYLESEFEGLGVDFDSRNDLTDAAIVRMKEAWSGRSVQGNTARPAPVQRPHPPIWIGGNSRRAIRRAAELADGWMPMPNPARSAARRRTPALESVSDLVDRLAYAREMRAEVGGSPLEVVFIPTGLDMLSEHGRFDAGAVRDSVAELTSVGVTAFNVALGGADRAAFLAEVARFGSEVIARA
jgi:probable F420-dependent oxidoreductase